MRQISYLLAAAAFFSACHSSKKTNAPAAIVNPIAKTENKTADSTAPLVLKKEIYRATNTRSSDIIHTRLDVNFDWTNCRMNGKAAIEARPYFYPTNMLYLNAKGMEIKKVELFEPSFTPPKKTGDKPSPLKFEELKPLSSSFVYENDSLKINLGKTFTAEQNYTVVIDYVAKPNELKVEGGSRAISDDKGLYFINPTGENAFKMPQIWTQGETQATSVWMPTIDSPNEKMTQEIYMTVENRFTTLSNGVLADSKKNADGTRTDHWKQEQPHAPYLAMMGVGEFKKVIDTPWNGKEVSFYVEKDYEVHAMEIFGNTKEMIDFYSKKLGVDYPWPKYSQIVVRDYVSGAMENTSATLHGDFMVYQTTREMIDERKGDGVIAHELFHQWFGDLVTSESWSNLPLNESFATYGEYLWEEYKNGRDAADYHSMRSREGYMTSQKEVDLIRFNYKDKEDMFDAFSYNKGGQVLHMLRKAVGDEAFFASLKNYLKSNSYKSAEIHNLRLAFEETTGRDMNWFFNQWFLNKGRPKLKVSYSHNAVNSIVELTVEQIQDAKKAPLYTLPLEVDVYTTAGMKRHHLVIDDVKQTFTLVATGAIKLVNFDAERQLLCDLEYKKSDAEYIYQYNNAPLYGDRIEALKELDSKINEPAVLELFKNAAQNDKFYAIRNFAIIKLEKVSDDKLPEIKPILLSIYKSDKKTTTRAKALASLNYKFANDVDIIGLNEPALNETSYAICGEAFRAIAKSNPKLAMEKAKQLENESGKDVLFPVASLYANYGADDQILFFHNALKYFNGFEVLSFMSSYTKTAKRCLNSSSAISAAMDMEAMSKGAPKFLKFGIIKGIKDLASNWESREAGLMARLEAAKKENRDVAEIEKELKLAAETKDILNKMYNRSK
ncbi:MAG: hypothetical protein IT236_04730 [Bacteroidia bacterium]|nr:hypothetical protein [Bacteroidia bacterium]